ncbi:TIR domain-containing protein [Nostoc sp. DSM 114167]|jgi:ABC-type branched-subunit amino acid transport system substrate-binding protein|uniref:TIR domain-containing protein n=1 Tax=Nostoc sp. DSM 114167 TaxID=3439050 RepID=UPI00404522F2
MNSLSFSGVVDEGLNVFFCYSRQDDSLRRELVDHLAGLINSGYITIWYDRMIEPGSNWQNEIEDQLRAADIVLLLVSAGFLASKYCYNNEMSLALERHRRGEICVIPVILRPCDWKHPPLINLQALPKDGKPVVRQGCSIDDSLTDVAREIRRVVEGIRKKRQPPPPPPTKVPVPVVPPPKGSWLNKITRILKIPLFRRHYRFVRVGLAIVSLLVLLIAFPFILNLISYSPNVEEFISFGEKSLLAPGQDKSVTAKYYYDQKLSGMQVFRDKDYKGASDIFKGIRENAKTVVERYRNDTSGKNPEKNAALAVLKDPEILIFRNNAQARQNHKARPESTLYTIAVAAPMKKYAAGSQILLGVAQAQDKAVNAPEDSKLNLQVLIADDGNYKSQAKNIATELANHQKDVIAVVGHYASSSTCSALPQYSKGNLVVISPGSTMFGMRLECRDNNKVFFRTVSSTQVEAESLVTHLLNNSGKPNPQVVVFYNPEEEFSKSLFKQFKEVLEKDKKGRVIGVSSLSAPNFSLTQELGKSKQADALAVFPDGQTEDSNNSFYRAIEVIEKTDKLILGANSLYQMETLNNLKDLQLNNRLIIAVDWHPNQPGADVFSTPAEQYWYGNVNYRTAMAYEATEILVKILLKSGVQNNRSSIKDNLSTFSPTKSSVVSDLTVSFEENGDRQEKNIRVLVTPIKPTKPDQNNSELKFCIVNSPTC